VGRGAQRVVLGVRTRAEAVRELVAVVTVGDVDEGIVPRVDELEQGVAAVHELEPVVLVAVGVPQPALLGPAAGVVARLEGDHEGLDALVDVVVLLDPERREVRGRVVADTARVALDQELDLLDADLAVGHAPGLRVPAQRDDEDRHEQPDDRDDRQDLDQREATGRARRAGHQGACTMRTRETAASTSRPGGASAHTARSRSEVTLRIDLSSRISPTRCPPTVKAKCPVTVSTRSMPSSTVSPGGTTMPASGWADSITVSKLSSTETRTWPSVSTKISSRARGSRPCRPLCLS